MSEIKRQSLSIDLDELFPGDTITIGNQPILIRPLLFEQGTLLVKKIKGLLPIIEQEGITWENFNEYSNIFKLVYIAFENSPVILEEVLNIDIEDLKKLPIEIIVQLVDKAIEVNMKSKEGLEKNFKSLIRKFLAPATKIVPKPEQKK